MSITTITQNQLIKDQLIQNEVNQAFDEIAEILFNKSLLVVQDSSYRFSEIEFYLHHNQGHSDNSVHQCAGQLEFDKWYFHKTKGCKSFKGGYRKGLDLALGDREKDIHFGILIRAMEKEGNGEYVHGPSIIVDRIEQETDLDRGSLDGKSISSNSHIKIIAASNDPKRVYKCPRKGLSQKVDEPFRSRYYRYFVDPLKRHDEKEKTIIPSWIETRYLPKEEVLKTFGRKTWKG